MLWLLEGFGESRRVEPRLHREVVEPRQKAQPLHLDGGDQTGEPMVGLGLDRLGGRLRQAEVAL